MAREADSIYEVESGTCGVFAKILAKEIPCQFLYEDDICVAFNDINPQAPIHFLVVPRKHIQKLSVAQPEDEQILGHLLYVAKQVAVNKLDLRGGFRIIINDGRDGCQEVFYLHLHVLGGRQLSWPPG